MRRGVLELCLIILVVIGIHAERLRHNGSIIGRVSPAEPAPAIIAIRGNDSVRVSSDRGYFGLELQPGEWKLTFAAHDFIGIPAERRVQVLEGRRIDLGEIRLTRSYPYGEQESDNRPAGFSPEMFYH